MISTNVLVPCRARVNASTKIKFRSITAKYSAEIAHLLPHDKKMLRWTAQYLRKRLAGLNLFLCECDFKELYEAIVECLDATGVSEVNGNSTTITAAYRMMKRIGDSAFFVSFQSVQHLFGYVHHCLSRRAQHWLAMPAHHLVNSVKETIAAARNSESEFDSLCYG